MKHDKEESNSNDNHLKAGRFEEIAHDSSVHKHPKRQLRCELNVVIFLLEALTVERNTLAPLVLCESFVKMFTKLSYFYFLL